MHHGRAAGRLSRGSSSQPVVLHPFGVTRQVPCMPSLLHVGYLQFITLANCKLSSSDKMMLWLGTCIKGLQYQEGWESLVTFHVWCAHVHGHMCLGVNVHVKGCRLIWEIILHCSPTLLSETGSLSQARGYGWFC